MQIILINQEKNRMKTQSMTYNKDFDIDCRDRTAHMLFDFFCDAIKIFNSTDMAYEDLDDFTHEWAKRRLSSYDED